MLLKSIPTDTENRLVDAKGQRGWRRDELGV